MKYILALIFSISIAAYASPDLDLFDLIEQQDAEYIVASFDQLQTSEKSIAECRELIVSFHASIQENFNEEISLENAKQMAFEIIFSSNLPLKKQAELLAVIDYLCESSECPIEPVGLFKGDKKEDDKKGIDIPTDVIIGGVEVLGGALLSIIPWVPSRILGAFMVSDGIRRTLNSTNEQEKKGYSESDRTDP